jgi:hypothetical protein
MTAIFIAALLYRSAKVNCRFGEVTGNRGVMSNLIDTFLASVAWTLFGDGVRGYFEATISRRSAFAMGAIGNDSE